MRRLWAKVLAISAAMFLLVAPATPARANGCGVVFGSFDGGDGSSSNPFQISTAEQLAGMNNIACLASNYNFRLNQDLDLSGYSNWTPLGSGIARFTGGFDGDGYSISNLSVSADVAGLFAEIDNALIENLRIENPQISSAQTAGALAAIQTGLTTSVYQVRVEGGSITGSAEVGGLFGIVSGTPLIQRVSVSSDLVGDSQAASIGGLIGDNRQVVDLGWAIFAGTITGGSLYAGGLAGNGGEIYVEKSLILGEVSATATNRGAAVGLWPGQVGSFSDVAYLDGSVAGISPGYMGTARTNTELTMPGGTGLSGWSFATDQQWETVKSLSTLNPNVPWLWVEGINQGYPVLLWEYYAGYWYVPCNPGSFSSDGTIPCSQAPAGSFVAGAAATSAEQCAAGSYQPSAGAQSCLLAQPGYFVAGAGATEQVQCEPGTTSTAGAIACSAIASRYGGPTITASPAAASPGGELRLTGSNLQDVAAAEIAGVPVPVRHLDEALLLVIPRDIAAGVHDLVLFGSFGKLVVQSAIEIFLPDLLTVPIPSVKPLPNGAIKIYVKDIVGAGKVQVFVNGREVAWVNARDASDPKLRFAGEAAYLVRTISGLLPQDKVTVVIDNQLVFSWVMGED